MQLRPATLLFIVFCLAACAGPRLQPASNTTQPAVLYPDSAVMADGYRLPLVMHKPQGQPRAILLGLHGFNDYRNAFSEPGRYFAARGIMTVAYDQRGFGATVMRGVWPGTRVLLQDARSVARLLCQQHPDIPLYLLGESMGGAVGLLAAHDGSDSCIQGVILVAPAIWGWRTMPIWQSTLLRVAAWLFPSHRVTGEGLEIRPSDNIDMLRALGRDPLVIKATRLDAIYGLTGLMDDAYLLSRAVNLPVLLLYGEHDEVIPADALCRMLATLQESPGRTWKFALYPQGYHMLLRDMRAMTVLEDIAAWVAGGRGDGLPSGNALGLGSERLAAFCRG